MGRKDFLFALFCPKKRKNEKDKKQMNAYFFLFHTVTTHG